MTMAWGTRTTQDLEKLAEMLVHVGRSARAEGREDVLTAAQWTALRFFARANQASRTPSAFASFQATTRGTASQTIKTLEQGGYLDRRASDTDKRSVCFEVTERGRAMLAQDPLRHLVAALSGLSEGDHASLARALPEIASSLAARRGDREFGTCGDCKFFETRDGTAYCACVARDLAPFEIGQLCARFAAAAPGASGDTAATSPQDPSEGEAPLSEPEPEPEPERVTARTAPE